jgi:hypothetical protein
MKPIIFPEQNQIIAKNQRHYQPLPVLEFDDTVTSVWKLSLEEIKQICDTGLLYVRQMNFKQPLQPIFITTNRNDVMVNLTNYTLVKDKANNNYLITALDDNDNLHTLPTLYNVVKGGDFETEQELILFFKDYHGIQLNIAKY